MNIFCKILLLVRSVSVLDLCASEIIFSNKTGGYFLLFSREKNYDKWVSYGGFCNVIFALVSPSYQKLQEKEIITAGGRGDRAVYK